MKKILGLFLFSLAGVCFGVALSTQLFLAGAFGRTYRAYIVQSGSMEPALKVGSIVFTQTFPTYKEGDIVTFKAAGDSLVTHRIFKTINEDGQTLFETKGDANEDPDITKTKAEDIVGKAFFTVPYFGYFADFVRTPKGFVAFIVIPAAIIIYEELKSIFKEIKSVLAKRMTKNGNNSKAVAFIPIVGVLFLFVSQTGSFFLDAETSNTNVMGAAASFGTPSPSPTPSTGTLVINEVVPDSSCVQGQTKAQWIEIYNGYPNTVNLKDFKITDGSLRITLVNAGNIDVPAGAFALLAHSEAIWTQCYADNGAITTNLGGQLDINTGILQLLNNNDEIIDTVEWGEGFHEPLEDQSIERDPDGKDTAGGVNFNNSDFVIRSTPQPGL